MPRRISRINNTWSELCRYEFIFLLDIHVYNFSIKKIIEKLKVILDSLFLYFPFNNDLEDYSKNVGN